VDGVQCPRSAAELIRSTRERTGISQTRLAELVGTRQPVISRWERGEDEPRISTLDRLLKACGFALLLTAEPVEVDRTQIRQQLAMTPNERLQSVANLSKVLASAKRLD